MPAVRLPFTRTASSGVAAPDDAAPAEGTADGTAAHRSRRRSHLRALVRQRRRRPWPTLVGGLLLSVAVAVGLTLLLNASSWAKPERSFEAAAEQPAAVAVSVVLVWVVVALLVALVGRLWLGLGLATAVALVLAAVNRTKIELRSDPLFPSDVVFLGQPGFLLDMVKPGTVAWGAVGLVALLALTGLVGWVAARWLPR